MNLLTALVLALIIAALIGGGIWLRIAAKSATMSAPRAKNFRLGSWAAFILAGFGTFFIFVYGQVMPATNPFAPAAEQTGQMLPGLKRDTNKPMSVPHTNADPAAAARDNLKLLEDAKRQQQEALGKK